MLKFRITIATILGLLTGLFCTWGLSRNSDIGIWMLVGVVLSRTTAGFAIGISRLKISWWLHGMILGFIFGLPLSFQVLSYSAYVFFVLLAASIVYGFMIELITSIVFRAKQLS